MNIGDLNRHYVVCRIDCGILSSGSGFFVEYGDKKYLISALHVIYNGETDSPYLNEVTIKATIQDETLASLVIFNLDLSACNINMSSETDLIAIELTGNNMVNQQGNYPVRLNQLSYFQLQCVDIADLFSKETFLYGYPTSLMPEAPFDIKPLLSFGIVSSYDVGTERYVTNIPAYYGNSGCPSFYVDENDEIQLLGIVQQLIPFKLDWKNRYEVSFVRMDWHNSGYSICLGVNKIIELLDNQ